MARRNTQVKAIEAKAKDAKAKAPAKKGSAARRSRAKAVAPKIEEPPICEVPLEAEELGLPTKFGKPVKPPRKGPVEKAQWITFLDHLALSSNVAASAREAEIDANQAYRRRRTHPSFCKAWAKALAEGYVRLEAELLGHALIQPNGAAKGTTLTARAQKYRLGLNLLAQHRASVKGDAGIASTPKPAKKEKAAKFDRAAAIARLEARFAIIRKRLGMEDGDVGPEKQD